MQVEAYIYLLDIRAFLEDEERDRLIEEAFSKLDDERREKARRIDRERGLAESLGAGLLLQLAVRKAERAGNARTVRNAEAAGNAETVRNAEAAGNAGTVWNVQTAGALGKESSACTEESVERENPVRDFGWKEGAVKPVNSVRSAGSTVIRLTVPELLKVLDAPLPLAYQYKENGKPYFINYSYYFNLSHSGDYVVCALSEREVGADLQIYRAANMERLAGRYFSSAELDAFRQAGDREAFFFRLWARKEAYGKLTGKGIADALGKDLWSDGTEIAGKLCWGEYDELPGYSMAVCQFAV